MQTLNISKSYINDLNYNSKCNPLQDQKILINSVLIWQSLLVIVFNNVCLKNEYLYAGEVMALIPVNFTSSIWKTYIFFFNPSSSRNNKFFVAVWSWHFRRQSLIINDTTNQLKNRHELINATYESRSLAFCLMSLLVELPEKVDTVYFSLLTISPCVFDCICKSSEEAEFCTLGNARYTV